MFEGQERCVCGTTLVKKMPGQKTEAQLKAKKPWEKKALKKLKADLICPKCSRGYVIWKEKPNQKKKDATHSIEQKLSSMYLLFLVYCFTHG